MVLIGGAEGGAHGGVCDNFRVAGVAGANDDDDDGDGYSCGDEGGASGGVEVSVGGADSGAVGGV